MKTLSVVVAVVLTVGSVVSACGGSGGTVGGAGDGGNAQDGGGVDTCASNLTFQLEVTGPYCLGACNGQWLTIVGPDGKPVADKLGCQTGCSECQPIACTADCAAPMPVPAAGLSQTWDGRIYLASQCTTSSGDMAACGSAACASPGHYVARMCVTADTSDGGAEAGVTGATCSPGSKPTCVDVPFEWPSSAPVKGKIP